jgi:hypothetical protein
LVPLSLQSLDVTRRGLVEQLLQSAPVLQAAKYFRHEFLRHIDGEPTFLQPAIEDITGVLFTGGTRGAVGPQAASASEAEGAEQSGLEGFGLILKPAADIGGRFVRVSFHVLYVP